MLKYNNLFIERKAATEMQREIYYHISVGIIRPSASDELLIGIYDDTYPLVCFRGRVNFFGGNQHPDDQSPQEIFEREIREEFTIQRVREQEIEHTIQDITGKGLGAQVPEAFAPASDITAIRDTLLCSTPYKDFLIDAPYKLVRDTTPRILAIYSTYEAVFDEALFACAKEHLAHGRAIKSEGFATIVPLDDVVSGKILSAGGTPVILSDYLGKTIPDPYGLQSEILGEPRKSLVEYEKEFHYYHVQRRIPR